MGKLSNPSKTMKRAIRHASRDASRPILGCVHLDEHGEAVATDSYRMSVEHGVWDGGENIDVPFDLAYDLAHLKASVKSVEIEKLDYDCPLVKATLPDGTVLESYTPSGKYPKWKALVNDKYLSIVQVKRSELLAKTRELVKAKAKVVKLEITDKHELVFGGELFERAWADGNPLVIGFDPKFVRDALNSIECDEISIRLLSPITPASFMSATTNDVEVIVMPVRLDEPKGKGKGKTTKHERKPKAPTKATDEELARSIYRIALDRAANDPDGRVEGGNASCKDHNLIFEYERSGQLTKLECGDYTSWYREGEFVTCIERRWSKRKIHLTYPELKPRHYEKEDKAAALKAERAAKENAGADVKATVNDMGDGVTSIVIEPKKEGTDMAENKRIEELEAALAELKAELKARNDELEAVWKENEQLKRKSEPKAEAPKPEPAKAEHETVAEVSLDTMKAWCDGKGLIATQKREGACIWVEGDSKPYADELKELGFRFAKKRKSWYFTAA